MAEEKKGVWRTVRGRRIFIPEGQDLYTAMKNSGKFKELNRGEYQKAKAEVDFKTRRDEYEQGTGSHMGRTAKEAQELQQKWFEEAKKTTDEKDRDNALFRARAAGTVYNDIKKVNKERMKEADVTNQLYGKYYDNPIEADTAGLEGKHLTPRQKATAIDNTNKEIHYAGEELYSDDPYRYMSKDKMRAYNEKMQNWRGPGDYYINEGKDGYYSVSSKENFERMLKENPDIKSVHKQTLYTHGDFGEKTGKYWDNNSKKTQAEQNQVTYKGKKYNITEVRNEGYFEGQNADEENPGTFAEHTPKIYRIENPNDKSDWKWITDKELKQSEIKGVTPKQKARAIDEANYKGKFSQLLVFSDYKLKKMYNETNNEKLKADIAYILRIERGYKNFGK